MRILDTFWYKVTHISDIPDLIMELRKEFKSVKLLSPVVEDEPLHLNGNHRTIIYYLPFRGIRVKIGGPLEVIYEIANLFKKIRNDENLR